MATGNNVVRQIVTTEYKGIKMDAEGNQLPCVGYLHGAYTDKRLNNVLSHSDPAYSYDVHVTGMKAKEYRMSVDDFVKYATTRA